MTVPVAVREAITNFVPPDGFVRAPRGAHHRSMIYEWGVRMVEEADTNHFWWACLASEHCRQNGTKINMLRTKAGKTSKVTAHLSAVHSIVTWKTEATNNNKRSREDLIEKYQSSNLYRQEPERFVTLLETAKIVRHNLPFRSVEYEESVLLRRLCYKAEFQATLNAKIVMHSMLELYSSVKREVQACIDSARMPNGSSFSVVTDFWTSKCQSKKFIGVRLYMVDAKYTFKSVLLGTREFNPKFRDRTRACDACRAAQRECTHPQHKIRFPFRMWINNILADFGLKGTDIFGSTTDGGQDVKWMMSVGFKCEWVWCLAHLSNAATKWAFGLVDDISKSANKPMTELQKRIVKTVYQTKNVAVMGSLFEELCGTMSDDGTIQLLDYRSHRFLGLTRVVERILLKWDVLVEWYGARQAKAILEGAEPPPFPLSGHKKDLTQLLSLLQPISANNANAQAEAPTQVDVLLGLFKLRVHTVNPSVRLRDHRSLLPPAEPDYFELDELTPLVKATRVLLCKAFHDRFFERYTSVRAMEQCSYVHELQLVLHPDFKTLDVSLKPIVMLCNQQHRPDEEDHEDMYQAVVRAVLTKLKSKMQEHVTVTDHPPNAYPQNPPARHEQHELLAMFSANYQDVQPNPPATTYDEVEEELKLWLTDRTALYRDENDIGEPITTYWRRQSLIKRYTLLPLVARAVFSVPSSSAQLERDFGVSGMQVTPQRASTLSHNVDMSAFVNRNYGLLDLTQCTAIAEDQRDEHIPSNVCVNLDPFAEAIIPPDTPPQIFSNPM